MQQGQHGRVQGLGAGQAFGRGRAAAHHTAGNSQRLLTGGQQAATALFLFPQQLFHKAAAAFFAVKQGRAADALLPEKAYFARAGAQPIKCVGRGAFAPAGIGQAKHLPQRIWQQWVLGRVAGQFVVCGVHNKHPVKVQHARFKHAKHL